MVHDLRERAVRLAEKSLPKAVRKALESATTAVSTLAFEPPNGTNDAVLAANEAHLAELLSRTFAHGAIDIVRLA